MLSPVRNEISWHSIRVVVSVDQCPNAGLEIRGREVLRYNADTFFRKKNAVLTTVPNKWLLLTEASTHSIISPKGLPFYPMNLDSHKVTQTNTHLSLADL